MSNDNFGNNGIGAKLKQLTDKFRDKNMAFQKDGQGIKPQIGERPRSSNNK